MSDLFVGDIGVTLNVDVDQSVASATLINLLVTLPDGTSATWTAVPHDTEAKWIKYTTVTALIEGMYVINPYIEWGSTSKHMGDSIYFYVKKRGE